MLKKTILILGITIFLNLNSVEEFQTLLQNRNLEEAEKILLNRSNIEKNLENWRKLGYFYKEEGNISKAIYCYKKIYENKQTDYDSKLALARLYFNNRQFELSKDFFRKILKNDKTDVEAYLGLARISKQKEEYKESIEFYKKALKYLPGHFPALFELAVVQSYKGNLDAAKNTYRKILELDNTWAEAWSGLGKMFWWQDKPFKAIEYYEKAIELAPGDQKIISEMKRIEKSINWVYQAKFYNVTEKEEDYDIKSFNQKYSLSKRLNDRLEFRLNSFWQYAVKDENNQKIKKIYDSSYLRSNLKLKNNELNFTCGGSINDSTLSVIDAGWNLNFTLMNINFSNALNLGNEYFYHWEEVRKSYLKENFTAEWNKVKFSTNYQIGEVEKNFVTISAHPPKRKNPFILYNLKFDYELKNNPKISLGTSYRFMDFKYKSSLYYSPANREIYGINSSYYQKFSKIYLYLGASLNWDNDEEKENNFEAEFGYYFSKYSVALSCSRFKSDYYESSNISLILGGSF